MSGIFQTESDRGITLNGRLGGSVAHRELERMPHTTPTPHSASTARDHMGEKAPAINCIFVEAARLFLQPRQPQSREAHTAQDAPPSVHSRERAKV